MNLKCFYFTGKKGKKGDVYDFMLLLARGCCSFQRKALNHRRPFTRPIYASAGLYAWIAESKWESLLEEK